jgi:signal peptidase II
MSLVVSALTVILGDQVLKYVVFNCLESSIVVSSFLRLAHVTNPGVAFGIGKNIESGVLGKYLFVLLSLAIVIVLLVLFGRYSKNRVWARVSLGLITGGATSNLIDRVLFGHVRDFIDFTFWPTFNPADLAICAGVVVLMAGLFRGEKSKKAVVVAARAQENPPSESNR